MALPQKYKLISQPLATHLTTHLTKRFIAFQLPPAHFKHFANEFPGIFWASMSRSHSIRLRVWLCSIFPSLSILALKYFEKCFTASLHLLLIWFANNKWSITEGFEVKSELWILKSQLHCLETGTTRISIWTCLCECSDYHYQSQVLKWTHLLVFCSFLCDVVWCTHILFISFQNWYLSLLSHPQHFGMSRNCLQNAIICQQLQSSTIKQSLVHEIIMIWTLIHCDL